MPMNDSGVDEMTKNKIFALHVKGPREPGMVGTHLGDGAEIPECRPQAVVPECSPQVRERAQREVNELFRHANREHLAMQELLRVCIERHIRRLTTEQ